MDILMYILTALVIFGIPMLHKHKPKGPRDSKF